MIGPSFEFKYFVEFIYLRNDYEKIPFVQCLLAGLKTLMFGCLFSGLTILFDPYLSQEIAFSDFLRSLPFYQRIIFTSASLEFIRIRYIAAFLLSESLIKIVGLSYDPTNEVNKHEKIYSINIKSVIFDIDMSNRIKEWNRQIHLWLKYNIYCRLGNIPPSVAAFITFMICAYWHGLRLSYPLFFIVYFVLQQYWTGFLMRLNMDKPSNIFTYTLVLLPTN